jgi:hypothetical protein
LNEKIANEKADNEEHYKKYNGLWGENLSQLKNRLVYSRRCKDMICIYCGENAQTREHCPPRSFFPEHDFPDNLRVLPACINCNKGFSHDEEIVKDYLNCIYDYFYKNDFSKEYPVAIKKYAELSEKNRWPIYEAERIFSKVAQGLAIYEMSEGFGDYGWIPQVTNYVCKYWVTKNEWKSLSMPVVVDVFPELGTRASDGIFIVQIGSDAIEVCSVMWTELKEDVFSYIVWMQDDIIKVRMILRDCFYVEVAFYRGDLI